MKQHAEIAVAIEAKFRGNTIEQKPNDDQNIPLLPLTGLFKDACRTSEDYKKKDKKSSSHSLEKPSYKTFDYRKESSDYYNIIRHSNASHAVEVLKPVNTCLIVVKSLKTYSCMIQSHKHNDRISVKLAKCAKRMGTQMRSSIITP